MNVYMQGDDFAICKEVLPEEANLYDFEIQVSIFSTGMPPLIEASTQPTPGQLKLHKKYKIGWFINIDSEVSSRLFPEQYNLQVTYINIASGTKRIYDYSAVFSIKNKLD